MELKDFRLGEGIELAKMGSWPATWHRFEKREVAAILAAWHANRPLLVRGDPGLGKSQLAQAVAQVQKRQLISVVVNARTEPEDLLFRFDHVKRLATAQLAGALGTEREKAAEEMRPHRFLEPGPLWWTLNSTSARKQLDSIESSLPGPPLPSRDNPSTAYTPTNGNVLLIDEIDKADSDLPNALLEVLNNLAFEVPITRDVVDNEFGSDNLNRPFIVITSNDERSLPNAFLRRCISLQLQLDRGDKGVEALVSIAHVHRDVSNLDEPVIRRAAEVVMSKRDSTQTGDYRPGTSEFLDLLRALGSLYPGDGKAQLRGLKELIEYTVTKPDRS